MFINKPQILYLSPIFVFQVQTQNSEFELEIFCLYSDVDILRFYRTSAGSYVTSPTANWII